MGECGIGGLGGAQEGEEYMYTVKMIHNVIQPKATEHCKAIIFWQK